MLLLLDHRDSFVHNLARYFARLGCRVEVVRSDRLGADDVRRLRASALVLSPGPCSPREAVGSQAIVRDLAEELPMLGVCLGHQIIAAAWGATVDRAASPRHGRSSTIWHASSGLFENLPSPLEAGRYHSLAVVEESLPECLAATARADDGTLMAFEHRDRPIFGVQFHPESILTPHGYDLLANFLRLAGVDAAAAPSIASELPAPRPQPMTPRTPLTY